MLVTLWLMINQSNLWNKKCPKISSNMAYELENRMIHQWMWGASIIFWQPDFCRKEHWTSPWSSSEVPEIGSTWNLEVPEPLEGTWNLKWWLNHWTFGSTWNFAVEHRDFWWNWGWYDVRKPVAGNMGVSINGGSPKSLVNGKSKSKMDD